MPAHYARKAPSAALQTLGRIGYATKGVVYGLVGALALQTAFGTGGSTTGSRGAIQAIAEQPFGRILLILTMVGLAAYALWRFVEAALDVEEKGTDAKGIAKRIGYAVSGVIYAGLAVYTGQLAFGAGGGGGSSRQEWTARLMEQPFGIWLVGIVGVIVIGVGLRQFYQAHKAGFMNEYKTGAMSAKQKRWARRFGQFGLSARGVTFVLIGIFFIQAARQADPSEAQGLGAALQTLAEQPYGPWLLALVALGFVAYGAYCFSRARYRDFEVSVHA